ncbi:MAG: hypothetical protein JW725_01390 [Candidatus Babeliaceae bacterium]|nr:hypothetical protein [Candidatus Babeliaceae bacterium]
MKIRFLRVLCICGFLIALGSIAVATAAAEGDAEKEVLVDPGTRTSNEQLMENLWPTDKDPLPIAEEDTLILPPEEAGEFVDPNLVPVLDPTTGFPTDEYWSFTLETPIFGKVTFRTTNKKIVDGKSALVVTIPDPVKKFTAGPLTVQSGELMIIDGKISYLGEATLWGQKARIGLKKLQFADVDINEAAFAEQGTGPESLGYEVAAKIKAQPIASIRKIVLGIIAEAGSFNVQLAPGKSIAFKTADLIVTRDPDANKTSAELRLAVNFFGQKVVFSAKGDITGAMPISDPTVIERIQGGGGWVTKDEGGKTIDFTLNARVKRLSLATLLPMLAQTQLGKLHFSGEAEVSKMYGLVLTGRLTGAEPDSPAEIEVFPGTKFAFKEYTVTFSPDKTVSVSGTATLLGQTINLKGSIDFLNKSMSTSGSIEGQIKGLIPQLASLEQVGGLTLVGEFSFGVEKERTDGVQFALEGKIKGSDSPEGVSIYGLKLREATARFNLRDKQAKIKGEMDIYGLLLSGGLNLRWGEQSPSFNMFASIKSGFETWQPFAQLPVVPKALEAIKDVTIRELKATTRLKFGSVISDAEEPAQITAEVGVKDENGSEESEEKIEEDVVVKEKRTGAIAFSLYFSGKSTILNTDCDVFARVSFGKNTPFNLTLGCELPKGWKMSQSFPQLFEKKTMVTEAIDLLKLSKTRFIISTRDTVIENINIRTGINFRSGLIFDGTEENLVLKAVSQVLTKTGDTGAKIFISGAVNPFEIRTIDFKVGLSAGDIGFQLGPSTLKAGKLNLSVKGEPAVAIEGGFTLIPVSGAEPLNFVGGVVFSAIDVGIEGSMTGTWKKPFGIPGFEFGNLGLKGTQMYDAFVEAVAAVPETFGLSLLRLAIPSKFGVTGETAIGGEPDPLTVRLFLQLGTDVTNIAVVGNIENPETWLRVVRQLARQMGITIPNLYELYPLRLKKASVIFAPSGTRIGEIVQTGGVGGALEGKLLGKELSANFMLDTSGLIARGTIESFNIGPLTFTGTGKQKDPLVDVTLKLNELPRFIINGKLVWPGIIDSLTDIELSKDKLAFATKTCVGISGMQYCARIKASTISLADPLALVAALKPSELFLEIEFEDQFMAFLKKNIANSLLHLKNDFERDMNRTIGQIGRRTAYKEIRQQEELTNKTCAHPDLWNNRLNLLSPCGKESSNLLALQTKFGFERTGIGANVRTLLEQTGTIKFIQDRLAGLRNLGVGVFEGGYFVLKDLQRLMTVERVYWKGTLQDIINGVIPGVLVQLSVNNKTEIRNLGSFNFRDPLGSTNRIIQQLMLVARDALLTALKSPAVPRTA